MRVGRSILSYLHLLVAATVLPLLGVVGYDYYIDLKMEERHARSTASGLAEMAAIGTGELVAHGRRSLEAFAKTSLFEPPGPESCRQSRLASVPLLHPEYSTLTLVDAAGEVICLLAPDGSDPVQSVSERDWFRRLRDGNAFAISRPARSGPGGRWVATMAHAVHDGQGRFRGAVGLAIDLERFHPLPLRNNLPPGTVITLLDLDGTVLTRSLEAAQWIGRNVRGSDMAEHLHSAPGDAQVYTDLDGVRRLCGFTAVPGMDWVAVAGIPSEVAFAEVRARVLHEGLVIALVVIAAISLALAIARLMAVPVRRMADGARALAEGKLETRMVPDGPRELIEVAVQFNRMLDVRTRTEFALGENKQRLQALFDNIRDGILLVDSQAQHVDANPAFCQLLGYTRDEILQMALWDDVPPALQPALHGLWERFLASGWLEGEFVCLRKDGSTVEVQYGAVAHFMPDLHLCLVRDITERRRLERERDGLLARLTLEFERMPMGCIVTDEAFRITGWNPAAESIFGFPRSAVAGRTPQEVVFPPARRDEVAALLHNMTQGRATRASISENLTQDGQTILCEWHDTPLYDDAGKFTGMISMVQDITVRREHEQKLTRYAEHLKSLSRRLVEVQEDERRHLAAELHDRTGQNLTAINLHLSMIREHLRPEAEALRARVDDAMTLVAATLEAVRDVMADLRSPVLEDYGLFAALRWYGDIFARRTGLAVSVSGNEPAPRLPRATETALFRVAQEAFTNVLKHANASSIEVQLEAGASFVRLSIADDGKGFDRSGERPPGASWGIVSMQERVEAVGGVLQVDAEPGRGTRIAAEVPNPG